MAETNNIDWPITFVAIVCVLIIVGIISLPITLAKHTDKKIVAQHDNAKFFPSDIVCTVPAGHKGIIVRRICNENYCTYQARFSAIQSETTHHILGSGGTIATAPMAIVKGLREFELEFCE